MAARNHISKITIVGAFGKNDRFMSEALLKTSKHTVTAIRRAMSETQLPEEVMTKKVDHGNLEMIVEALRGHEALVIILSGHAPKETEADLVRGTAEAGVEWILPNEWSADTGNEDLVNDLFFLQPKVPTRRLIDELGKSSFISVYTGCWYEWFLAMGPTSIRRAVAARLGLPIKPEGPNDKACLRNFKNNVVYVKSFTVSQKGILESALRVTGTKIDDWTIAKERSQGRYSTGVKELREGKRTGYAKFGYARVFFSDGSGDIKYKAP
ncbi:hypothetical protein BJY01DRAFT_240611 [Aspergillus pseudoustus]|uniref:NmrA-like domain-containing protein n=1 Tax=Aspergillus pseudoustus TaxID=1810923 RepID=A0ABR4IPD8_9EURO